MTARHLGQLLWEVTPLPVLWVPAWLLVLIGGAVVCGGLAYFARSFQQRAGSARRALPRRATKRGSRA